MEANDRLWFRLRLFVSFGAIFGTISSNKVCDTCKCTHHVTTGTWSVDCEFKRLEEIPPDIPVTTVWLNLASNHFTAINKRLSHLALLKVLDLSGNKKLYNFRSTDFKGLYNLEFLRMEQMSEARDLSLCSGLFQDTFRLKSILLSASQSEYSTNCNLKVNNIEVLQRINTLEHLGIPHSNLPLPPIFKDQIGLRSLTILSDIDCNPIFTTKSLSNLPHLTNVTLDIYQMEIKTNPFLNLKNWWSLHLLYSPDTKLIEPFFHTLQPLVTLRAVSLQIQPDVILLRKSRMLGDRILECLGLVSISSIQHLELNGNMICDLTRLQTLPHLLQDLYLRRNCIPFEKLFARQFLMSQNLKTIDMLDQIPSPGECRRICGKQDLYSDQRGHVLEHEPKELLFHHDMKYQRKIYPRTAEITSVNVLRYSEMPAALSSIVYSLKSRPTTFRNVTTLKLSVNGQLKLSGDFLVSFPRLVNLDLSNNRNLTMPEENAFSHSLKTINLQSSNLNTRKLDHGNGRIWFQYCPKLEHINLMNCQITSISSDFVTENRMLRSLDLSTNKLTKFETRLQGMNHMSFLNLSNNELQFVAEDTLNDIKAIAQHLVININVTGNNFICSCQNLLLFQMIAKKGNAVFQINDPPCHFINGTNTSLRYIHSWLPQLERECQSYMAAIFGAVAGILAFVAIIVGGLMYRYRWKLRYFYYSFKHSWPRNQNGHERIFEYDAFISYAEEDSEFVRKAMIEKLETEVRLRLCVHERDFVPGDSVASNITLAINNSRRTVLLLSQHFLRSKWCMYELNMARVEALYTERVLVLMVLLEQIPASMMPLDVLGMMRSNTYLEYAGTEKDKVLFWQRCIDFIQNA